MSMNSYILPCIMTVKDVLALPMEIIECFTSVTTGDVESYIKSFMKQAESSNDAKDKEAAEKINRAYVSYYKLIEDMNSSEMDNAIQLAANTNLADISYNMEDERLDDIKARFTSVLEGESKLMKLDEQNFTDTVNYMIELAEQSGDAAVLRTVRNVTKNMKNMSNIFINKNGNIIPGSRLVSALKFKDKMISILKAIEDVKLLKERGQGNVDPRTWRCF